MEWFIFGRCASSCFDQLVPDFLEFRKWLVHMLCEYAFPNHPTFIVLDGKYNIAGKPKCKSETSKEKVKL